MPPRLLQLLATGFEYLPLIAGFVAFRRLTTGRRWVWAWGLYSVVGTVAQHLAARSGSNLWLNYILVPLDASLAIWALSCFTERPVLRLTLRWAVPSALFIHILAVVFFENRNGFSILGAPSYAIIAFGAALAILVTRALDESEPVVKQDWFWISGAYALYFASLAVFMPLAAALIRADPSTVLRAVIVFVAVNMVAYTAVAVGLLCPRAVQTATNPLNG